MSQPPRTNRVAPFERVPLAQLDPGNHLDGYLVAVRSASVKVVGTGKSLLEVKIGDSSGHRIAKRWEPDEDMVSDISGAAFIELWGDVESSERYAGEIKIAKYRCVPTPSDVSDFIEKPNESNRHYQRRFSDLIKTVGDPELNAVLRKMFGGESDLWRKFKRAYAAGNMHHAFAGGLLEHTVEVAELASRCSEVIKGLDRDLLVTGALLHDIGKMEEMDHELRAGEYTDDGCLIGHLVLGSVMVAQAIDQINSEAESKTKIGIKTKRALMHLILSHHGLPEHGAARRPSVAEAYLLYLCDNMSAKANQFIEFTANSSAPVTAFNKSLDAYIYVAELRDRKADDHAANAANFGDFLELDPEPKNTKFVTAVSLPVLGRVAAGSPDEKNVAEASEYRKVVPPPAGADFLLYVVGDSMIDAGINEGDLLFVKRDENPPDGEIVVAHISGEGQTVKRLRLQPANGLDQPHLEPANAKYSPILIDSSTVLQGKVTGLVRDF